MATPRDAVRMQEAAKRMKEQGIRRKNALCPICYRIVAVPMDRHFYGAVCN
jgi:hypothetical protein